MRGSSVLGRARENYTNMLWSLTCRGIGSRISMTEVKKSRKIIVVAIGMLLVGVAVGEVAGLFLSPMVPIWFAPKYLVHVDEALYYGDGHGNGTMMFYYAIPLVVTFNQNNGTIAKCFLGTQGVYYYTDPLTGNVTLPEGQYTVNVFNSVSGIFIETKECYAASEITVTFGPYRSH